MIRRVGHVRVFAALGSFISAVLILYPAIADPLAWMRGCGWSSGSAFPASMSRPKAG